MSFPRYERYKDSGVEWLGEVPQGWEVKKLKFTCDVFPSNVDKKSYDDEISVSLCNYTDVYYNDKITADMPFMKATATDEQIKKFTLKAGDTIITKDSETADDIAIAAYVPHDLEDVICGYHLSMVRPKKDILGLYIKNLFDSSYLKSCFAILANGLTRVGLSQSAIDNVYIPVPNYQEQTTIAAFLDCETAKIDNLINEQKKLIELLKEKRQAVISTAVTNGLNPHAPMKDSGVEWLGEVPIGWEVVPLKNIIAFIESGTSVNSIDTPAESNEFGVLKTSCVYRGFFEPNENKAVLIDEYERVSCPLRENALIVSRMNTPDLVGAAGLVISAQKNIFLPDRSWKVAFSSASPNFVHFWTLSCFYRLQVQMACSGTSSSMQNLGQDQFRSFIFVNPPLNEQVRIAAFLDQETAKIDNLIQQAQKASTLLQERRTALISAAVTGKIDVRGFVTTNTTANCVGK